jgi:hypothetical protein
MQILNNLDWHWNRICSLELLEEIGIFNDEVIFLRVVGPCGLF